MHTLYDRLVATGRPVIVAGDSAGGTITMTYALRARDENLTPPAAVLLKKEAGIEKGSGTPNRNKVGSVTKAQVRKIAEIKLPDLNTDSIESAMAMVAGAARSMGIEVRD